MEENGLAAWGRWLKWRLWDSWHGTSVSAFDERRTSQDEAPGLNLGFFRISWARILQVTIGLIVLAVLGLVGWLLWQITDWRVWVPAFLIFVVGFAAGYMFKSAIRGGGKNE